MPRPPTDVSEEQAQLWMSLLIDGELDPRQAEQLKAYLESHPEAMEWMESLDATRQFLQEENDGIRPEAAWRTIKPQLEAESPKAAPLFPFPQMLKSWPVGIAAAIALCGTFAWINLKPSSEYGGEQLSATGSNVEFVSSDIPGASPVVYTDRESGWTIVWVESIDPIVEESS